MKTILVATDFSKNAYAALHYATRLFQKEKCLFYIANYYGDKVISSVYGIVNEQEAKKLPLLKEKANEACLEIKHRIVRETPNLKHEFKTFTSPDKMVDGIPASIESKDIDMVVMGTQGISNARRIVFGSNTTKIIAKSLNKPLLVVPRELEFTVPLKIAFASELMFSLNDRTLKPLADMASSWNTKVSLLHIGDEEFLTERQWKNLNNFKKAFSNNDVENVYLVSDLEVSQTITDYVNEQKIDLLTMVYYQHHFLDQIFRESVVKKINLNLSFPFLILPTMSKI